MPGFVVLGSDRPDTVLAGVKKGDWVRLLEPHYDGQQHMPAGAVVRWWNDSPPTAISAALPDREPPPSQCCPYWANRRAQAASSRPSDGGRWWEQPGLCPGGAYWE